MGDLPDWIDDEWADVVEEVMLPRRDSLRENEGPEKSSKGGGEIYEREESEK